jgi:hypothetical protein
MLTDNRLAAGMDLHTGHHLQLTIDEREAKHQICTELTPNRCCACNPQHPVSALFAAAATETVQDLTQPDGHGVAG